MARTPFTLIGARAFMTETGRAAKPLEECGSPVLSQPKGSVGRRLHALADVPLEERQRLAEGCVPVVGLVG